MTEKTYSNEARYNQDKLSEVRQDLTETSATAEKMVEALKQLQELSGELKIGVEPAQDEAIARIKGTIGSLKRDIESTFGHLHANLDNTTYLGNIAAARYGQTVEDSEIVEAEALPDALEADDKETSL